MVVSSTTETMAKSILYVISFILLAVLASSCATSNDVISENKFQKRKYQKGYHVQKKSTFEEPLELSQPNEKDLVERLEFKQEAVLIDNPAFILELKRDLKGRKLEIDIPQMQTEEKVIMPEVETVSFQTVNRNVSDRIPIEKVPSNTIGIIGFSCLILFLIDALLVFSGVGFIFLLAALVLGIIGVGEPHRHKQLRSFAQMSLYGSLLVIALLLLAILALSAAFGGSLVPFFVVLAALIITAFLII